jgi:hypothetical protein
MKFQSISTLFLAVTTMLDLVFSQKSLVDEKDAELFNEDERYWVSYLNSTFSHASLPTLRPHSRPPQPFSPTTVAPPQSLLPSVAHSYFPTGKDDICKVKLKLRCSSSDDEKSRCLDKQAVTSLSCQGCRPTNLCFMYSPKPCPISRRNYPDGLLSCIDYAKKVVSKHEARLVALNGFTTYFDKSVQKGEEFCISDAGGYLPDSLKFYISSPLDEMNQREDQVIKLESSCLGDGYGLNLLDSYGSVTFTGYQNCEGNNRCYIPLTFTYSIQNLGTTPITLRKIESTFSEDELNLLTNSDRTAFKLFPAEKFISKNSFTINACTGKKIINHVTAFFSGEKGKRCRSKKSISFGVADSPTAPPMEPSKTPFGATQVPSLEPSMRTMNPSKRSGYPSITSSEPSIGTNAPIRIVFSSHPSSFNVAISIPPSFSPTTQSVSPTISTNWLETAAPSSLTASPSASPIASSALPSVSSMLPSDQPSSITPEPSTVTTLPPVSSTPPSSLPSTKLSLNPSTVPSSLPSQNPTPTYPPSFQPSNIPSFLPSFLLSLSPSTDTLIPTSLSDFPSIVPTTLRPEFKCSIEVSVDCKPSDNSAEDCNAIPIPSLICEETPFAVVLRYTGGKCDASSNLQPSSEFSCFDFDISTPLGKNQSSFVVITDSDGRGIVYHSDFAFIGTDILIEDDGNNLAENLNITIYASENISFDNMLQTVSFRSACDTSLFIKDQFGSFQIIVFINTLQGAVTCDFNVTYVYTIENTSQGNNATIMSLESVTNVGILNLTNEVEGTVLAPKSIVSFSRSTIIDLSLTEKNTVDTKVQGFSNQGILCIDDHFLSYTSGQKTAISIPTSSPTETPTFTSLPTPDPEDSSCELLPIIECVVIEGSADDCSGLQAPSQLQCLGDRSPYELRFLYTGEPCPGINNADGFRCDDRNGGPEGRDSAWLLIRSKSETLYNGTVNKGSFLVARGAFDDFTDLTVYSNELNGPGDILQAMRMRTVCQEQDDLTLQNTFGSLQLIGFASGAGGSNIAFASVQINYYVRTRTGISAVIQYAESIGALAGKRVLRSTPSAPLNFRDVLALGIERQIINLVSSQNEPFNFTLKINGTSVPNPTLFCSANLEFSFTVL